MTKPYKELDSSQHPRCLECIYSQNKKGKIFCNIRSFPEQPTKSKDDFCGEGRWMSTSIEGLLTYKEALAVYIDPVGATFRMSGL